MGKSPSSSNSLKVPRSNQNNNQQQQATSDDLNSNEPNDPDDSRSPTISHKTRNINIPIYYNDHNQKVVKDNDTRVDSSVRNKYKNSYLDTNVNLHGSNDFNLDIDISLAKSFASSTTVTTYSDYCSSTSSNSSNSSYASNVSDTNTLFTTNTDNTTASAQISTTSKPSSQHIKAHEHLKHSVFAASNSTSSNSNNANYFSIHQTPSSVLSAGSSNSPLISPSPVNSIKNSNKQNSHTSGSHLSTSYSSIPNNRSTSKPVFLKRYPTDSSSTEGLNVDDAIEKLLKLGETRYYKSKDFSFHSWEIQLICYHAREILLYQPSLLKLQAPIKVVGDVHGQFTDLLRILKLSGVPPDTNYLFLGDYVDRGKQSLETILLLLCYKIKYRENFFMLRGNHESANVTKMYGFYDECKRRKNTKVWKMFVDVFNSLPFAAIIQDKIFCVHGGISPELNSMSQIANIKRPTDIPEEGFLTDILWSDPNPQTQTWSLNDRGVSFTFGKRAVADFCSKFKFDLIIRGHMVVEDGYEFFAKKKLVTIFSAPNYCGEFENWGAVLSVTTGMMCSFELLKPHSLRQKKSKKNN
ncbi:hypothetical protein TPHA_0N01200 [Tetrapisispora phaffii CBS 4417]|uniref:Serine/threonine-protein phosphatase n=1 Tax=Tetrapisispora phaffii (strain ATCC 24235 / CBS 4417 / NBRC 1672 / NRRL Y-8282 / UCD 70-5) TaxID=1071381 RepID=G8C173_TETPH|nr:hypothetical protein TPHA_0N01200 [Tetrapisispora phaffii CBS 4417]CCE65901.1 hypothetical protein TPHA_0N01200 [Tetrapisispora phaffii CBS 4417]